MTIVVGANAAGKTNLLEGIMLAAVGKSYRGRNDILLQHDSDWARIDVHTSENQTRVVKLQRRGDTLATSFEIDQKPYSRLSSNTKQPVVLFEPNDLLLFHQEPQMRREYLDQIIEQLVPGFATNRRAYKRVVSQRNALLKRGESLGTSQLFAWNIRLSELGEKIVTERLKIIEILNKELPALYSEIAQKPSQPTITYQSKTNLQSYGTTLLKQLESQQDVDMQRGFTSRGPHRDDIVVLFDGASVAQQASRGEIRTLLLGLKIIELRMIEDNLGKRPLLLLDDVFSELDGARRRALTHSLKDHQTIITTTDADAVVQHFTDAYHVIAV